MQKKKRTCQVYAGLSSFLYVLMYVGDGKHSQDQKKNNVLWSDMMSMGFSCMRKTAHFTSLAVIHHMVHVHLVLSSSIQAKKVAVGMSLQLGTLLFFSFLPAYRERRHHRWA